MRGNFDSNLRASFLESKMTKRERLSYFERDIDISTYVFRTFRYIFIGTQDIAQDMVKTYQSYPAWR